MDTDVNSFINSASDVQEYMRKNNKPKFTQLENFKIIKKKIPRKV